MFAFFLADWCVVCCIAIHTTLQAKNALSSIIYFIFARREFLGYTYLRIYIGWWFKPASREHAMQVRSLSQTVTGSLSRRGSESLKIETRARRVLCFCRPIRRIPSIFCNHTMHLSVYPINFPINSYTGPFYARAFALHFCTTTVKHLCFRNKKYFFLHLYNKRFNKKLPLSFIPFGTNVICEYNWGI